MNGWLTAASLLAAATVVGWPARQGRVRWAGLVGHRAAPAARRLGRHLTLDALPPGRAALLAAVVVAVPGGLAGGPVAATVAAVYGWLAARTVLRGRAARETARRHREALDDLCGLAADLRAGLPAATLLAPTTPPTRTAAPATSRERATRSDDRLARLTGAAARLAEQTGAPLAELVERIEADARAMDRARAAAAAQAAGARATGYLLAGLPVGGIALGYGIGVDPLAVLLHSPIGAACALGAVALQFAGLTWTDRLVNAPDRTSGPGILDRTGGPATVAQSGTAAASAPGGAHDTPVRATAGAAARPTTRDGIPGRVP
ncbi:hypothetical protein QCD66_01635 [Polymorphospora sp. A560]